MFDQDFVLSMESCPSIKPRLMKTWVKSRKEKSNMSILRKEKCFLTVRSKKVEAIKD